MVDLSAFQVVPAATTPPLTNGDRLSSEEFARRYSADPQVRKAELIEGVVYVASPLRFGQHAEPHADLMGWLWLYKTATPGVRLGIEPTVRLDRNNQPQPDGVLLLPAIAGGTAQLTADDYVDGAPDLVVEIAASSAAIDLNAKRTAYQRNGVREYLVWQIYENQVQWWQLVQGEYVPLSAVEGVIRSAVFPGLWLAVTALQQRQTAAVLTTLQAGLQSPEHAALVQTLTEAPGTGAES